MLSRDFIDIECEKGTLKSPAGARFRLEPKNRVVYTNTHKSRMSKKGGALLQGIVEADETYIGGRPCKESKKEDREPAKRGWGMVLRL